MQCFIEEQAVLSKRIIDKWFFVPFYSLSWVLLCCLDEIFTMALTPFLCNLSNVCLEMFRSSGPENPLLQPAFAEDYSSHYCMLKEIHWTKWWNSCMVPRLEIFCERDPAKHPAQRWRAVFYFYERGKNTEVEQFFEAWTFERQVNEGGEDSAASLLLFDS